MEKNQFELFDYAYKRVKQKKRLYYHFILFLVGSVFMIIANKFLNIGVQYNWFVWAVTAWGFLFILHLINVFITERFMNKSWEKQHIERLIEMQKEKLEKLENKIEDDFSKNADITTK